MTGRRGAPAGRAMPLAAVSVLALVVSMLVVSMPAADALTRPAPVDRGIARVCPPPADATVPQPPDFRDARRVTHGAAITCAGAYGLVTGFDDGTYRPGQAVTRGQMATFVLRWLETAMDIDLPAPTADPFTDIAGDTHRDAIATLARFDVVAGRGDGRFAPRDPITRGQMARFVANAIDFADNPGVTGTRPAASDVVWFADAVGSFFQGDIQALAAIGIVQGDDLGRYRAGGLVTRGQLATFLLRAADYLDLEQRWEPTHVVVTHDVALSYLNVLQDSPSTGERRFGLGRPEASGRAVLTVDAFGGRLEAVLDLRQVPGPFAGGSGATLRLGADDANGPSVLRLATGAELQAAADGDGRLTVRRFEADATVRLAELIADPERFHVSIATNGYPQGAVRGQLPDGGQDRLPLVVTYPVRMTGEQQLRLTPDGTIEVGAGELGAAATVQLTVDVVRGLLTYEVDLGSVTAPYGAAPGLHLHAGAAGRIGPLVARLASGEQLDAAVGGRLTGTLTQAAVEVPLRTLVDDPTAFYVDLHSDRHPGGAVRGQLR